MVTAKNSEVVTLAQQLVRINSENPPGREGEVVHFVRDWFSQRGIGAEIIPVLPERDNLLVRLPGESDDVPPLVFLAHADTVPAGDGWQVPPFAGEVRGDRLYGRGACDMKGPLASLLISFGELLDRGESPKRQVLFCLTVDEEMGEMSGAVALARQGIIPREAMVVAIEPTSLQVGVVHKGAVWYRLSVTGRASHAGRADLGADAIHGMVTLLYLLKEKVSALPYRHPLLGPPSVSFGLIRGGQKTNVVSDYCVSEVDFRLVPPMTCGEANGLLEKAVAQVVQMVPGVKVSIEHIGRQRPPVQVGGGTQVVGIIREAHLSVLGVEPEQTGFFGYTDAAVIAYMTGNPQCVAYGPGDLRQAHTIDEFISVSELEVAVGVFTGLLRS